MATSAVHLTAAVCSFRGDVSTASHGGSVCEHDVSFLLAPQRQSHAPQDVRFQATWDERAMNDLKRTTLDKINLKHLVLIGNVHEKIWEWMAISTRYLYAPPLQCRRSRILGPALAQTVSLGPDIEGAHSTLKGRADFAGAC